jgi:sterol desaturase/sphingolipid hydroxylase (fatty acid hydroxylase superfamily)
LEVVFTLGASLLIAKFFGWITSHYGWHKLTLPSDGPLELAAGFGMYWLLSTFLAYWGHRVMHTPVCWNLHRFHHSATELNILTTFRQHPLEPVALNFIMIVSPAVFLNIPDKILVIYFFWGTGLELLGHSQLPWGFGWIGRWVIASPRYHQFHHSIDAEHRDVNFSNCPLWDQLFGTAYTGPKAPSGYGIPDTGFETRPARQFVVDVWMFYSGLAQWLWSSLRRLKMLRSRPSSAG